MIREEQDVFLSKWHAEAIRYMNNANDMLRKAGKLDDRMYNDDKYVGSACGIAYLGVLVALDAWLTTKGVQIPKKKRHTTIEFYLTNVAKIDKKMLAYLNSAYNVLHLEGYYRKETSVDIIAGGFKAAYYIIDKIKPENPVDVPETRGGKLKRAFDMMMISIAATFGH